MGELGAARRAGHQAVGRRHPVEDVLPQRPGGLLQRPAQTRQRRAIEVGEVLLALSQEGHRPVEHLVVEGRLDMEDVEVLIDDAADAIDGAVQLGLLRLHVALRAPDGLRRVVGAQAQVVGQAGADGLVASVHGDEVHVQVDDEVRLGGLARDAHLLVHLGLAQFHDPARLLGVVVRVAVRVVGVENLASYHPLHFLRRHPPVERVGDEQVDVVHARIGEQVEDDLQHDLPHVRRPHGRERQGDVVHRDQHLHAGAQLGVERIALFGMVDRPADRRPPVGQRLDGRIGEHHSRPDRQLLEQDLAVAEDHPRRTLPVLHDDLRILVVALPQPVQGAHL